MRASPALQTEYRHLPNRLDASDFFDSKSAEWRTERDRLLRDVGTYQAANHLH